MNDRPLRLTKSSCAFFPLCCGLGIGIGIGIGIGVGVGVGSVTGKECWFES